MRKICVIASGGDGPGMNACAEAIFLAANANGMKVYAAVNGFDGLVEGAIMQLTRENCTGISCKSGCVFGCNRGPKMATHEGFKAAMATIKKYGFDCLVVMGGNGTLMGTGRFKNAGVNTLFIPGTIDNDVPGHKNSLGFASACESAVKLVDMLRATMETSERDHIVQLMGRNCNELALRVGEATFADIIDMEGARVTPDLVAKVFKANRAAGKRSNIMIMQERKGADVVSEKIEDAKFLEQVSQACGDPNIRMSVLGYLQRGADPTCFDRYLASQYGRAAVECVLSKTYGVGLYWDSGNVHTTNIPLSPIP